LARAAIPACLALTTVQPAQAQDDFYANKRISIVVGFGPGGGIDAYARTVARYLGNYIPGNPTVIVVNMPGAAGLTAVMSLDASAPKDGTTIVAFNPALVVQALLDPDKYKVNFSEMTWLGSVDEDLRLCYMWGATGVKTLDEMLKRDQVIMADSGAGSTSIEQRILRKLFGVKLKQVFGYQGSAEKQLAVERGEVEGDCGAWTGTPDAWIKGNKINVVMRFNKRAGYGMPESVPFAGDLLKDPKQKALLTFLMAGSDIGRPYILSKSVPTDRIKTLRVAFDKTVTDTNFLADAEKRRLTVVPTSGAELQEKLKALYAMPPDVIAEAREILED
jgi:tripartite-type tricarboxylate transporter receptor subunit TctC